MPAFAFFNDGDGYLWRQGDVRSTQVFDTMTAAGELPPIVAVFVNPGASAEHEDQRSIEYDTVSSRFVEFINTEIVPLVREVSGIELTTNPAQRLICGISSGGICAFNAAWHSPKSFGLVLSHCGLHEYSWGPIIRRMIRRTRAKPLRVFLNQRARDLNIVLKLGSRNQDNGCALDFAGYDYRFAFGEGGTACEWGSDFADSLRWLFRSIEHSLYVLAGIPICIKSHYFAGASFSTFLTIFTDVD